MFTYLISSYWSDQNNVIIACDVHIYVQCYKYKTYQVFQSSIAKLSSSSLSLSYWFLLSSLFNCFSITLSVWRKSMACINQLKLFTVICFRIVWNPPSQAFSCSHAYMLLLDTITNELFIEYSPECWMHVYNEVAHSYPVQQSQGLAETHWVEQDYTMCDIDSLLYDDWYNGMNPLWIV